MDANRSLRMHSLHAVSSITAGPAVYTELLQQRPIENPVRLTFSTALREAENSSVPNLWLVALYVAYLKRMTSWIVGPRPG